MFYLFSKWNVNIDSLQQAAEINAKSSVLKKKTEMLTQYLDYVQNLYTFTTTVGLIYKEISVRFMLSFSSFHCPCPICHSCATTRSAPCPLAQFLLLSLAYKKFQLLSSPSF